MTTPQPTTPQPTTSQPVTPTPVTPTPGAARVRIMVITRAFPYPPGEQFVAPEVPFWNRDDAEVVVLPVRTEGDPWVELPDGVRLDDTLARLPRSAVQRYRARALASPLLWRDVWFLARRRRASKASLVEAMRATSGALMMRDALLGWAREHGRIDVVYNYWFDVWALGALLAHEQAPDLVGHVVSRVHRYDLYEEHAPARFQGLKRQLAPRMDAILPIARQGADYVRERYGVPEQRIRFSPLGVELPPGAASTSPAGELHVLSTALVSPVKRVDRLADALVLLAGAHPELQVHWTHVGGGDLLTDIRQRVEDAGLANLHARFPGTIDNQSVRELLATGPVDVFVNTSTSEGVPVSIMEAMAFGVPALAPAVGGIGELVPADGPGGMLFSVAPDAGEVCEALWRWRERCKDAGEREAARSIVAAHYDEQKNFTGLWDFLVSLAAH